MSRAHPSGFAALFQDYKRYAGARLWLALAIMLLAAIAEGFGLLMIVPLASFAIGRGGSDVARVIPWFARISPNERFSIALLLFVGAMAARSLLLFARDLQTSRLSNGYEASLRLRAAATLAERGWPFAAKVGQAGMQSLLLNDVPRSVQAVVELQQFAVSAAMLLVQLILTAILAPVLTAIAVAILASGALASAGWTRRGVRSGVAIVESMEESASAGFRLHAGLKAALAQGTVPAFLNEYGSSLRTNAGQFVRYARDYSAARQLGMFGAAIAAAVLLFVGVRLLATPFAVLVTTLVLFARMTGPALSLQQSVQQIAATAPAFAAIESRIGTLRQPSAAGPASQPLRWTELRLDQAAFEHQPGLGLKDASLIVRSGEWVGIAGPSGAGKTTLIDIVAGLLPVERGFVTIDGEPLDGELLDRWRIGLAYVGQDGAVFDDTIRANLVAEASVADDARLWESLGKVGLTERVRAFPSALDQRIGDRGSQLSGGERQRLVIARALLRCPTLLILDEATAALDEASEAQLFDRLRGIEPRPAALLVAHRRSSLGHCDCVVSIQHGVLEKCRD
ncbi:MAG TPA: ABC transporter ATP-binding protein [Sphingomicrobium sp.]|nr:ABC transporter ATP-binding protein [Sphingomicrobium sp.]